mmetsp:Transcript_66863/g.207171  ORF Transcript_66863/g.207171 Transcript_66863/m.207171 type:complete len:148 (-) Transcript_66863:146-589(-)
MAGANPALVDIKGDVAHRLEASGALDQIRTQIRASVFRALLGAEGAAAAPQGCQRGPPVQAVSVVADFLQRLDFGHTREVFLRESGARPLERGELAEGLAGCAGAAGAEGALLERVLAAARHRAAAQEAEEGQTLPSVPATIPEGAG